MVRYEWDDGYLLGKKKKVFQALKEFSRQVQMRSGLVLQASKSVVYTLLTYLIYIPEATGLIQAEVKQGGQFHPGFLCYGVLIEDEYVSAMLDKKVIVLEALRQCMWVMHQFPKSLK